MLRQLALWWKLREFARKDAELLGVGERRACVNCGKYVNPLTSWINYGQLVCGGDCWMALRYPDDSTSRGETEPEGITDT